MKNIVRIVLLCVMGVYVMTGIAAVLNAAFPTAPAVVIPMSATAAEKESTAPSESGYIVKTVSGKIAVEDVSSEKIIRITDTRAAILPEKDREKLEEGILVSDESELRSILEDLCS